MVPDHTWGAHPTTSGRIVSVPVSGACSTMRVREDVGGGGSCIWSGSQTSPSHRPTGAEQLRHFLLKLHRNEAAIFPCVNVGISLPNFGQQ